MKNFTNLLLSKAINLMIVFLLAFPFISTAQVNNITHPGSGPYATIQQAIDNAATVAGDILTVAAGTYYESVNVHKSIHLKGTQADNCAASRSGPESIINCIDGIGINASNVTINGFTIQSQSATNSGPGFGYAVYMAPPNTGTQLINNIIKNNVVGSSISNAGAAPAQVLISCNWFDNNNNPGPASGAGIYTDEYVSGGVISNVRIDGNKFTGHVTDGGIDFSVSQSIKAATGISITNNEFDGNRRALFLYNVVSSSFSNNKISNSIPPPPPPLPLPSGPTTGEIRIYGGVNNLLVNNNSFTAGAPHAIRISDDGAGANNSNITVFENSFTGYSVSNTAILINSGYPGVPLPATCNWWGTTDGEVIAAQISGAVGFTPWLTNGTDNSAAIGFQPVPNSCSGGIPKLTTSINGVVINANNDGTDDLGSFAACNTANNILFNSFTDQNGLADPKLKVYQTYTAVNVTVPFCNNCSASMALFAGATGTAALVNPALPGSLTMRFRSWIDADGSGIVDPGEYASDWIQYTITINALPTVSFDLTGNSVFIVNNGYADLSELATVAVCNGGTYSLSNLVNSSTSNRYTISVTPGGGGLLFNGSPAGNGDISAAQFTGAQGSYTVTLSDPAIGGNLVQVITPYNDVNGSNSYDAGDCLGDPVTITYIAYPVPKLETTINGVTVTNNADGLDDVASIAVCNSVSNNLSFTQFVDLTGATPAASIKVIQQFTLTNVTFGPVDGIYPIGAYSPAFDRNVSLVNASLNGTLVMKFRIFYDINGDDILDVNECANDWVVYTVTVNPLPVITVPTVTQPTCAVPTGTIVVNATGTGTLEYSINGGADWFLTNSFPGLAPGSYTVSVRLQSNPGCMASYLSNPVVLNAAIGCIECPLSQGYWKNHPSAWPESALPMMLGTSNTYTKQQLLTILKTSVGGDASLILAHQLIAAKLNIAAGATAPVPVPAKIIAADAAIGTSVIPMNVKPSSTLGKTMTSLASTLDKYNTGQLNPACITSLTTAPMSNGLSMNVVPESFELEQNYPNPFSSVTTIRYVVPVESTVSLAVYNTQGQLMAKLADGWMRAGNHQVRFDASKLAAGIYIYRLQTTDANGKVIMINRKMILSK